MNRVGTATITTIALILMASPACAETVSIDEIGVTISVPDAWTFTEHADFGASFNRKNDPDHYYGVLMIGGVKPNATPRSLAQEEITYYKENGIQCSQIYEDRYIAGLWTAFFYSYPSSADGRLMSSAHYAVIKGNETLFLILSGPSAETQEGQGLLKEFDYIKNSIRFR